MVDIADSVYTHAEKIMKAAGSTFRHYETRSKADILAAVMDCYEEAYRAGSAFATDALKPTKASKEKPDDE